MKDGELPDGWEWKKIKDICQITNGRAFKPSDWSNEGLPIVRIQNLNNNSGGFNYCNFPVDERHIINTGQLLFSWSGTPGTSFGAFIWERGKAVLNQHIFRIELDEKKLDKKYLMAALNSRIQNFIQRAHGSSGLEHITKGLFENTLLPVPPLPVQHQIVAVLEQAEAVKRQRHEADALTGALLQSVFLEMFGDPVRNEKGWELKKLNDLIRDKKSVSCGPFGSQLKIGEYTKNGVPVLGIDNVGVNKFVQAKPKFITQEKYEQLIAFKVKPDDILISRTGTIARTCGLPENFGNAIIGPNLLRISLDQNKLLPIFLSVAFNYTPSMIEQILRVSPGATVAVLNTENLRNINIIVPPLALQQQFARVVQEVERIREQQAESKREIDVLFNGLMAGALCGELSV